MPIYYPGVAQNTEQWDALRRGIPTSSHFEKIWTPPSTKYPKGQKARQWEKYACVLLTERYLNRTLLVYVSEHMEKGKEKEPEAVSDYEWETKKKVELVGFVHNDAKTIGCSPDGLVGEDGIVEFKVPKPENKMWYIVNENALRNTYYPQLQGQLYVSERKWVDAYPYNDNELPSVVRRCERDEEYIGLLAAALDEFNDYLAALWNKLVEISGRTYPEAPQDAPRGPSERLKGMLEATLAQDTRPTITVTHPEALPDAGSPIPLDEPPGEVQQAPKESGPPLPEGSAEVPAGTA